MRPAFPLLVITVALASRASHADNCYFEGRDYYHLDDWEGACFAATSVPLGCPVGVLVPHGVAVDPVVIRGQTQVTLTTTATLVDSVVEGVASIDVIACDCPPTTLAVPFDRYQIAVTGAQVGDYVTVTESVIADESSTSFDAAATCPPVTWPSAFGVATACDLCPGGGGSDMAGSDSPGGPEMHGGGCAASTGTGGLVVGIAIALSALRRRRQLA
ncbi:MAG TPA: hypothetical protein VGO00_18800 [Kofleriaceae bacterium]|nr:hypothetical protein [Kofleriaceae bacterium]